MRLLTALLFSTALFAEWPQFRGNPALTGVADSGAPPAQLKLLWTWEGGEQFESSPIIAGGVVYIGSGAGDLLAIDLTTGKTKWKYKAGSEIGESTPTIANGIVYVGDLKGVLHAVNAADGKGLWTYPTGTEIKSSPIVHADKVLIGSYDQSLYALNAKTGKLAWKYETTGPVHATPAVKDGIAYIAGCDEHFRAIRIADGKEIFQVSSGAYTGASPALAGNMASVPIPAPARLSPAIWPTSAPSATKSMASTWSPRRSFGATNTPSANSRSTRAPR
ncbi:MAG: PQQ-binding-like beta-propeller repeat protein [Acidobacteria bacterium]|nr:PQQ-binding-like beta-propeller repeat protein [Acidobacteriota bacterium]